jgi:putative ABC transport system permease protein
MIDSVRFALRQIHKNPGFATLAILTLALGIGANTAMFTVIDSVMLRPLPYRDADRIVAITPGTASEGNSVRTTSWINYLDIREQARQFRAVVAYAIDVAVVRNSQTSQGAVVVKTTASLFDALGVRPMLGRPFTAADNQPGAANVVILTAPFWREHFAANRDVVGQQVRIGNDPYTVVGVLPEGLSFSDSDASKGVWLPYQPDWEASKKRNSSFLYLMASLRPGVSLQAAQSELTSIARSIAQREPEHAKDLAFRVIPYAMW